MTNLLRIVFFFLLFIQITEYDFNRKLVYEVTDFKDQKKNRVVTYLANEENNSYNAYLYSISKNAHEMTFVDQNGIFWRGLIDSGSLNSSSLNLDKEQVKNYSNPYKYQVHNYDFVGLEDTLLNNKICKRFMLKSTNIKRGKKKNLASEVYVIDTSFNMKPLLVSATAYEIWKLRKNIPNGLIVEKYHFDKKNEMIGKEKLISNKKISLKFTLPLN